MVPHFIYIKYKINVTEFYMYMFNCIKFTISFAGAFSLVNK
jgi:hypothetical protein